MSLNVVRRSRTSAGRRSRAWSVQVVNHYKLPRPLSAPFQAAAAMLLHGEVTATAWLPTCDVISARQWSYQVRPLSGVHLRKGKERKSIYIAPFCTKVHSKRSGVDHTVLPANNTTPALPGKSTTEMTSQN